MRRSILLAVMALLFTVPAWAQVDVAGEWGRDNHEDQPHRAPGAELGDYTGHPINAAARQKAESWDASILSQPEQQAKPHPAQYSMRGPQPNLRISKVVDPVGGKLVAYTMAGYFGRADRTIWMDGRPRPSQFAEHTFGGFSTGEWVAGGTQLKVTTTHMKTAFINRNGIPSSYRGVMTEFFSVHGDVMVHLSIVDDPVYLEEPMVRSNNFRRALGQHVGPAIPFETVDELGDRPIGWVPHWPVGTRHTEYADRFNLPWEATRGGKESLYPEYAAKIEAMRRSAPANRTASSQPQPAPTSQNQPR
jgi:hypothetical protein